MAMTIGYKEVDGLKSKRSVFELYKETNVVYTDAMIRELSKRTHLPKWLCRKVYVAEDSVLADLGIMTVKGSD